MEWIQTPESGTAWAEMMHGRWLHEILRRISLTRTDVQTTADSTAAKTAATYRTHPPNSLDTR